MKASWPRAVVAGSGIGPRRRTGDADVCELVFLVEAVVQTFPVRKDTEGFAQVGGAERERRRERLSQRAPIVGIVGGVFTLGVIPR